MYTQQPPPTGGIPAPRVTIPPVHTPIPRPGVPTVPLPRPTVSTPRLTMPTVPVPRPTVPVPIIAPTVPRTTVPQLTVPRPTVPTGLRPITPAIPQPTVPPVPRPTVPPVPRPMVPPVPRPTVPPVPRPTVPPVPRPMVPPVPRPVVTQPPTQRTVAPTIVTQPTITRPTVPPVPRPTVPPVAPTVPRPTVPPVAPTVPPRAPLTVVTPPREIITPTISPQVPNIDSPTEIFIETIIAEQDADIMDEKEYLGYVRYLLNEENKYDVFARLFPDNTCPSIIFRMESYNSPVPRVIPSEPALVGCIRSKERTGKSIAVYFTYENHANMLWFDTENKLINRYDPQVSGESRGQDIMDDTVRLYLSRLFPEYVYLGNTLESWQCVQGVREQGRAFKADYYCQDYSLLYAINRINGMSHEEAAFDLVGRGPDILIDLAELLRALAYKIRSEIGRPIPERFRDWRPTTRR